MPRAPVQDTHAELRRLAIAGVELGAGDARLKQLIPQAEKLGERAKVFSRVAGALKALRDRGAPAAFFQAQTLTRAIKSTQTQPAPRVEITALQPPLPGIRSGRQSSQRLRALSEALSRPGRGRAGRVKRWARGLSDLRVIDKALSALDDAWVGHAVEEALGGLIAGKPALVDALEGSLSGKRGDLRRIGLIAQVDLPRADRLALAFLSARPRPKPELRVELYQRLSCSKAVLPSLCADAEHYADRCEDSYRALDLSQVLLPTLAKRREPEATASILGLLRRSASGDCEPDWIEVGACPYFSEDVQAFLRASALEAELSGDEWSPARWGELLTECARSEENIQLAVAIYEMDPSQCNWESWLLSQVDEATIERFLKKHIMMRGEGGFGGPELLRVASRRLHPDKFHELSFSDGWQDDEALDFFLSFDPGRGRVDPRWLTAVKKAALPRLVLCLSEAGDAEAEAYFLERPKHRDSESWPKVESEPLACEIIEGEGYMIGRVGEGWASFISRGQGERYFGLSLDLQVEEGSTLNYSLRGDFYAIESCTATLRGADGAVAQRRGRWEEHSYPKWSPGRVIHLPAGRLLRLDFQLFENASERRGFVQLWGLSVNAPEK